jgi:hypothetical protein
VGTGSRSSALDSVAIAATERGGISLRVRSIMGLLDRHRQVLVRVWRQMHRVARAPDGGPATGSPVSQERLSGVNNGGRVHYTEVQSP